MSTVFPPLSKAKAWSAHAVTASGVVLALLALIALIEGRPQDCLLWLGAALIVDGLDGTLARRFEVKQVLPQFDGSILDLVIDYLTYVFIPAIFIYRFVPLPDYSALPVVALILVSSLYCFCNVNMKSADNYFVGFPAAWNVVAAYLYLLDFNPWLALVCIVILAALTVTKLKFLHPFRVRELMVLNISVTLLWTLSCGWLIAVFPERPWWVMAIWLLTSAYFIGVCFWRSAREWWS